MLHRNWARQSYDDCSESRAALLRSLHYIIRTRSPHRHEFFGTSRM